MKKEKRTVLLLRRLAAVRGKERELMPRPTAFEDRTKYSRSRDKQRSRREREDY